MVKTETHVPDVVDLSDPLLFLLTEKVDSNIRIYVATFVHVYVAMCRVVC